ncbi:N-terminal phage integrase SAM-like domain-containing protein [Streptomyces hyaluromycini]|uniref:N-terminal phage integrase SAM-like domain-containing protein n=1 Tax=Streptomyces hyaluromycini TaxID=1377993 RepID=UPI000B5C4683|nr:N-terminal phage integrase SAM-like domain-containing protein [Streptomyces hyaluromycini]
MDDWLERGLKGRDEKGTIGKNRSMANKHLLPFLGKAKLRELSADDIDDSFGRDAVKSRCSIGEVGSEGGQQFDGLAHSRSTSAAVITPDCRTRAGHIQTDRLIHDLHPCPQSLCPAQPGASRPSNPRDEAAARPSGLRRRRRIPRDTKPA